MVNDIKWQYVSKEDTLRAFDTDEFSGLDEKSVSRRRNKFGDNFIWRNRDTSLSQTSVKYIFDLSVVLLVTVLLVAAFSGFSPLSAAICLVSFASAVFRFLCEFLFRRSVAESVKKTIPEVRAIRQGRVFALSACELVPGDIILLYEGDVVPADVRIVSSEGIFVSEGKIGGENAPPGLSSEKLHREKKDSRRGNIAFAGSYVVRGSAKAVCIACGERTFAAQKGIHLAEKKNPDPSRIAKTEKISAISTAVMLALSVVYVFVGFFFLDEQQSFVNVFLSAFSFAASGTGVVYVSHMYFSYFMHLNMLKKSCVISADPGACDRIENVKAFVINDISTLKSGSASVEKIYYDGRLSDPGTDEEYPDDLFSLVMLSNGVITDQPVSADRVEDDEFVHLRSACMCYCDTVGKSVSEFLRGYTFMGASPKSAENPCNTALYSRDGEVNCVCCGDVDVILPLCSYFGHSDYEEIMSDRKRAEISSLSAQYTSRGMRVLAVAKRVAPVSDLSRIAILQNSMIFVGFAVFSTPLHHGVSEMFAHLEENGVSSVIFSSDKFDTALLTSTDANRWETVEILRYADLARIDFAKQKNYIFQVERNLSELPKIRYFLMKELKKKSIETAYLSSGSNDAAALSEGVVKICVRPDSQFHVLPAILSLSGDFIVSENAALCDSVAKIFSKNVKKEKHSVFGKYLFASQILRFVFLLVSLFTHVPVSPIIFLIWGLVVDQTVGFMIFYCGKR